ncbi:uncharacterized protein LOC122244607 isoform X2 [Penaeus japonicus]|uniref:uncharacterized protein LOC122244607 isoform X2 n=1 Tax=Penaeus japonicus TaxID=27405 RepID=UPI001C713AAE|nr:uncharacterized protein LOC122244607 isoform X2 [Penaeus japonicus]
MVYKLFKLSCLGLHGTLGRHSAHAQVVARGQCLVDGQGPWTAMVGRKTKCILFILARNRHEWSTKVLRLCTCTPNRRELRA